MSHDEKHAKIEAAERIIFTDVPHLIPTVSALLDFSYDRYKMNHFIIGFGKVFEVKQTIHEISDFTAKLKRGLFPCVFCCMFTSSFGGVREVQIPNKYTPFVLNCVCFSFCLLPHNSVLGSQSCLHDLVVGYMLDKHAQTLRGSIPLL